ncbi:MAG: P-loop NTPase, partial [Alphaproteobacteria bacterium]|nr:P-loop NTPase [Alphaproteobacteria bacterium]
MATEPAANLASIPALGRNVITVASGKGGVGKTWFAITLAHAMARAGRKTLLFDGDLGLANVDIQLGLMP